MQGIPSRVVIGYVPGPRNPFSGWQLVRMRDAHSWTEGYIEGFGWLHFDATPGPPGGSDWSFSHLTEALDFAWYSYVVNFDGLAQKQLFTRTSQALLAFPAWLAKYWFWPVSALVLALLLSAFRQGKWKFSARATKTLSPVVARHRYGRMLQAFQKLGFARLPNETPAEFLARLHENNAPALHEAEIITQAFCETNYGLRRMTPENQHALDAALHRLMVALRTPTKSWQPGS
jgi:hypothetical protein